MTTLDLSCFDGKEKQALELCFRRIAKLESVELDKVVDSILTEIPRQLTVKDLDKRNYTYVTVYLEGENLRSKAFLVSSPYKKEAARLAKIYIKRKGWKVKKSDDEWSKYHYDDIGGECISLYPRNYIKKARILYTKGYYL